MGHPSPRRFRHQFAALLCLLLLAAPAALNAQSYTTIAAGGAHSLAIKDNGTLWAWGSNIAGQIGDGTAETRYTPTCIGEGFTAISAGGGHSLALKADGSLWAWGWNAYGQVGDGTTENQSLPVQIGEGFAVIAAGDKHSLAIKDDGTLWAWGSNALGQLGDGTKTERHSPVQINEGFSAIAGGYRHSLGVKTDGTLWGWGDNNRWQLGVGLEVQLYTSTPVQIGEEFVAVTAGEVHSHGLKIDSSLWSWGNNDECQLADMPTAARNRPYPSSIGMGYVAVSAGQNFSLGLRTGGVLWAWGDNEYGQRGTGSVSKTERGALVDEGFAAIAAGGTHSLGLKTDGTLWSWGNNNQGQLGNGSSALSTVPTPVSDTDTPIQDHVYFIPCHELYPDNFDLGFGIANLRGTDTANVILDYYDRNGMLLTQEKTSIPAGGHTSFMSSFADEGRAWVRVSSTMPIEGTALAFGRVETPMYDMDFKSVASKVLLGAHMDTSGSFALDLELGWRSTLMVANPTDVKTMVYATWYPDNGSDGFFVGWNLPAMGAVRQNLHYFFSHTQGSLRVSSEQPIAGFLLYDGRHTGHNWLTGLTLAPLDSVSTQAETSPGEYVYSVPYAPADQDFDLGFGLANPNSTNTANVFFEYYSNDGLLLGQESTTIAPQGHTSLMSGLNSPESGWVRISSNTPLGGVALGVGYGEDPLFDMDLTPETSTTLLAAHIDTSAGWISKAMLANPNDLPAETTVVFHADDAATQTINLTIPAMGAAQCDLGSAFPDTTGALEVISDQGLAGFILYDGRTKGRHWVGGLAMQ